MRRKAVRLIMWLICLCLVASDLAPLALYAQGNSPQPPILEIEDATASAVAWSPDGTMLAIGDNTGILLYTEDLQFIKRFNHPTEKMEGVAWSPNGVYIASVGVLGGWNVSKVHVWNVATGELVTVFEGH